jgi:NTE family protein
MRAMESENQSVPASEPSQTDSSETGESQALNVVLGGGGIKGIGLVGAMAALEDSGYHFNILAGCSAGAIVAALSASGMRVSSIRDILEELDFNSLLDNQRGGRLGYATKGYSMVRHAAINSGDNLMRWTQELLEGQGVRTFADLRRDEPDAPMERRYKLVVIVADITHGRLLRLPWDYPLLDLDPDTQSVAEAIRAATALPFLYKPHRLGNALLADGGIVMNYPIGIYRELRRHQERIIGVRLSFAPEVAELHPEITGLSSMARAMVTTSINAQGEEMMRDPDIRRHTILVDVDDVKVTDFHIGRAKQQKLYLNGYEAAQEFLRNQEE